MRENHGLQFILDDIDGKLRRNAAEIRNVAGNHNFLSELPATGKSWQMRMGDNSLRDSFGGYPHMSGTAATAGRHRKLRWGPAASNAALTIDSRDYHEGDVLDILVYGVPSALTGLAFKGINNSGFAEDVHAGCSIAAGTNVMYRFVKGGGSGRGFHAWSSNTAMSNISQIQGMQVGDYVVNTYSAAVTMRGVKGDRRRCASHFRNRRSTGGEHTRGGRGATKAIT